MSERSRQGILILATILATQLTSVGAPIQANKLVAQDAGIDDYFGSEVSVSGGIVIVGAFQNDEAGQNWGAAYVFDAITGTQLHKITVSGLTLGSGFGFKIAARNGVAVVGAPWTNTSSGAAFLYNLYTGTQIRRFTPSESISNDRFGFAVAISDEFAVVGARSDNIGSATYAGSAYVFDLVTGAQRAKLLASDPVTNAFLGSSAAIDGNLVLAGAQWADGVRADTGAAYIFDATTGTQLRKLSASDGAAGDNFGANVALSNGLAFVGAFENDGAGIDAGAVYVFDVMTGNQLAKLVASDARPGDGFGCSVSVSGERVLIGAFAADSATLDSGAAYLFDIRTLQEVGKLTPSDGDYSDRFGISVAIDGQFAVAGAMWDDDVRSNAGAAYVYTSVPEPGTLVLLAVGGLGALTRLRRGR